MPKKLILVLVFFFFGFSLARAEVIINEIMYDPKGADASAGGEWIEVKNTGSTSVNLTDWIFFENDTNHGITTDGTLEIPPGEYAVISSDITSFENYFTEFSKLLFRSSFSLNDSEKLAIKINKDTPVTDTNSITYNSEWGAKNDGNSLQLINGSWVSATPTPGMANSTPISTPNPIPISEPTPTPEPKTKAVEIQKIKTQITAKTLGFVGLPLSLNATTLGLNGEPLRYGKYFWNFGDGDSKEINLADNHSFSHIYFYPGDYVVSLDYFSNPYIFSNTPDASSQMTIKIIRADISISRVGDEKDFFVELSNNTNYSADLSNWVLASDVKNFIIPRNTILQPKKTIIISPKITNFSVTDKNTLKLMNPEREIVFSLAVVKQDPTTIVQPKISIGIQPLKVTSVSDEQIKVENLEASAMESDMIENNLDGSYLPILSSVVFIGTSAGAVYFIRRKKVIPRDANDFEILDE